MSLLYRGKAKELYETPDPQVLRVRFLDGATAFDGRKRAEMPGKGSLSNLISCRLFAWLNARGVRTHFLRQVSDREMEVRRLRMLPVEVVVRNRVAGSLQRRLGLERGRRLEPPVVELYLKDDARGDPWVNAHHLRVLGIAGPQEVAQLEQEALRVNALLGSFLTERGMVLVDVKFEFGWDGAGRLTLGDELSPDVCRIWDEQSGQVLDKDRFRHDLGDLLEGYREVWRRIA